MAPSGTCFSALLLSLLLAGCASDPIELNMAIGYRVTIQTADTTADATGPTAHAASQARLQTYADIAPGRSK